MAPEVSIGLITGGAAWILTARFWKSSVGRMLTVAGVGGRWGRLLQAAAVQAALSRSCAPPVGSAHARRLKRGWRPSFVR
jgi:hypothetical protein